MNDTLNRLRRTKRLLTAVSLVVAGVSLLAIGRWVSSDDSTLAELLPWSELGGILFGAGLLGVWIDHIFEREQEAASESQLRRLLTEHAPVMRDAVLQAFAAEHADLQRVATPETLDQIIGHSLGLRLGDQAFADDVYHDVSRQAIDAPERWEDVSLDIRLTPHESIPGYFSVTSRWEYTTTPVHLQRKFVCLSDRLEFGELAKGNTDTSVWFMKPNSGFRANSRDAYELLNFVIDGREQPIRRTSRKNYQSYVANVGAELVDAAAPVTISYTTKTVTTQVGHLVFFEIEQPTNGISISLDYSDCDIATISAIDMVPSVRPTRIEHSPEGSPSQTIRVEIDGWVFPRAGVAFVWSSTKELELMAR